MKLEISTINVNMAEESNENTSNRRLVLTGYGGLEKLQIENRPLREPRQGDIRIKVENWLVS